MIPMLLFRIHPILIGAAVIPAVILMLYIYRSDRLEREPVGLLVKLALLGVLATVFAMIGEKLGFFLLRGLNQSSAAYQLLMNFLVVGLCEEGFKYLLLRGSTWNNPNFNCRYDGVVYAVFVSLGFALWENISYVLHYGLQTAIVRALTAIPGHACFGVFMGVFYGLAKRYERNGRKSKSFRVLAVVVPAALHGTYDYIASVDTSIWYFVGFVAVLFVAAYTLVGKLSKNDRYL
jgi:RsiW-degrading membrane proteinase PrsW (M82 family)